MTGLLPLARLQPAPWNARKSFDEAGLAELTRSIADHGLLVPLLVRPIEGAGYEIVAGHRRALAAARAGWEKVLCDTRELTDEQAREIGLIDNLQREDVPALEEADAYEELRKTLGTAEAIARRVGKPIEYVVRRLKLRELTAHTREALAAGLIALDHALLLAKLGAEEEEQALRWTLDKYVTVKQKTEDVLKRAKEDLAKGRHNQYNRYFAPQSVQQLRQWIEEHTELALGRAPWDLDDAALLPTAGACSACPKNTQANRPLFGDLAIAKASCTDAICWNLKRQAFVQVQLEAMKAAGADAVRLSWKPSTAAPRMLKDSGDVNPAQTFKRGQWVEVKKAGCEHVRTGVTVDFGEVDRWDRGAPAGKPGKKLLVCVQPKCKAHPKAWEKAKRGGGGATPHDEAAEKDRRKRAADDAEAEIKLRVAAAQAAIAQVTKLPEEALRLILRGEVRSGALPPQLERGVDDALRSAPIGSAKFARAVAARSLEHANCWVSEYNSEDPKQNRRAFLASLKRIGYDGSKHWLKEKAATPANAAKKARAKKAAKKGGRK